MTLFRLSFLSTRSASLSGVLAPDFASGGLAPSMVASCDTGGEGGSEAGSGDRARFPGLRM